MSTGSSRGPGLHALTILKQLAIKGRASFMHLHECPDDEEEMWVERRSDCFYGCNGKYDFERNTAEEVFTALVKWGYAKPEG